MPTTENKRKLLEAATKKDTKQTKLSFCKNNEEKVTKEVTNFFHHGFFEIAKIRRGIINC